MAYIFTLIIVAIILAVFVGVVVTPLAYKHLKTDKSKKTFSFIATIVSCVLISVIGDILQATIFK